MSLLFTNLLISYKPLQGSDSGAMRVLVNGSGMDMYVKHGSSLPIFAFSEPIVENKKGEIIL